VSQFGIWFGISIAVRLKSGRDTYLDAVEAALKPIPGFVVGPEDECRALAKVVGGQAVQLADSCAHQPDPFDLPQPAREPSDSIIRHTDVEPLRERIIARLGLVQVTFVWPHRGEGIVGRRLA